MFPSGAWRGYWDQLHWGRQEMHDLTLRFGNGAVEGSGRDVIGAFTFQGTYDAAGGVTLVKQYLGRHRVLYQGRHDGEGTIFGRWSIGDLWTGQFALAPARTAQPPDAPIRDL
jgi:hypothetical protein